MNRIRLFVAGNQFLALENLLNFKLFVLSIDFAFVMHNVEKIFS